MKHFTTLSVLFFLLWSAGFVAQQNNDSLMKRARLIIYENPDEAISIALKLLKQENKTDEVAHLYMLVSNAYIAKRNNDSSLYYILKATDLIDKEALPTTKIKILNSVAVQYQQMELYDKALETLDKSLILTEKLDNGDKERLPNIGFNYAVRGMIYRNQSNPDLALEKFKMAAESLKNSVPNKNTAANLRIINYNIGYCYMDLEQLKNASQYFALSETYAKTAKAKSLEAYALKGQGESQFITKNYSGSLEKLYRAEELALPIGDLILNEGIYKLLANNNLALNNFEKFQVYNNRYLAIRKTLEQNELKSLNRYLNTRDQEEKVQIAAVTERFRIYNWLSGIAALVFAAFLVKNYLTLLKRNRRQRKLLETLTKAKK
ncbi:tetratricopeptide repeat protein [Kaistella palustris]|uniref:tetratricopeptide repeat protein n=1 Tax=Kaistella palustris TaxID=493376 RepID=UPI0004261806|nr:tetratricopeptide repeat protein [Kaistella palustris]